MKNFTIPIACYGGLKSIATRIFVMLFIFLLFTEVSLAQTVDYRKYQSPVKHQQDRGTCTAFAVVAAMETFSGFPTDLSEQYIYAMVKMHHYDELPVYGEGAHLQFYIDVIQQYGALREDQEPYNPNSVLWDTATTNFEMMKRDLGGTRIYDLLMFEPFTYKLHPDMYTYLVGAEARDIDYIKTMLDGGVFSIPVTYNLSGYYWFIKGQDDAVMDPADFLWVSDGEIMVPYTNAIEEYGKDVIIQQLNQGGLLPDFNDTLFITDEGHAVAICGYNDEGFIIKNSWGTDWGDGGYCIVTYDYHRLFVNEVLVAFSGMVDINDAVNKPGPVDPLKLNIKSMPVEYKGNDFLPLPPSKRIRISVVYYGDEQVPQFEEIVYVVYDESGNKIDETYGNTSGIFDGKYTGYCADILGEDNNYPDVYKVEGSFTTKLSQTFQNTYYNIEPRNKEYEPVR